MASTSEEMDQVELEGDTPRPGVGPARARVSGPALRGSTAFDDVTPTRSLAEVGLADMDEDLPTKMQTQDELARFRAAAADDAPSSRSPTPPARRDVLRPPPAPAIAPSEPPVFRSFPPPAGREHVPTMPPPPAVPSEAKALVARDPSTESIAVEAPEPIDRGTKILLLISVVLMALAVSALVIERFVP